MARATLAALAPVALLLAQVLAAASAQAQDEAAASPPELRPVVVALEALPVALRSAIAEAEDHLLADVAQRQLEETYDYVQGFAALPPGSSSLRDDEVRAAYAWAEDAVVTFLALPGTAASVETAGATCRNEGETVAFDRGKAAVETGLAASRRLEAIDRALAGILARVPPVVDASPVAEAVAVLRAWLGTEIADIEQCLVLLAESLGLDEVIFLEVEVVPSRIFPSGKVQVFGSVAGAAVVQVEAPAIGWTGDIAAPNGTFHVERTVPRGTPIGTHDLRFAAAGRTVVVALVVAKASVQLEVEAPRRVVPEASFLWRASVRSVVGPVEVDRAALQLDWMENASTVPLESGGAMGRLATAGAGRQVLVVHYPGSDILAAATATREVLVIPPVEPAPAEEPPAPSPAERIRQVLLDAPPWLMAGLAAAAVLLALVVARGWRRRASRPPLDFSPPPPPIPGGAGFVAAMALLFVALRRLRLVPPGRTVREWLKATNGSSYVADHFEAVRYGRAPETPPLAQRGRDWVRRAWRRWVP